MGITALQDPHCQGRQTFTIPPEGPVAIHQPVIIITNYIGNHTEYETVGLTTTLRRYFAVYPRCTSGDREHPRRHARGRWRDQPHLLAAQRPSLSSLGTGLRLHRHHCLPSSLPQKITPLNSLFYSPNGCKIRTYVLISGSARRQRPTTNGITDNRNQSAANGFRLFVLYSWMVF